MMASPTGARRGRTSDRRQEERDREHEADEMRVVFPEAEDRGGHPHSGIVLRSAPWIARVDGPLAPVLTSAIPPGRDRSKIEKAPRNRGHTELIPLGVAAQRKKQSKVAAQDPEKYEPGGARAYEAGAPTGGVLAATPSSLTPSSSHGGKRRCPRTVWWRSKRDAGACCDPKPAACIHQFSGFESRDPLRPSVARARERAGTSL